MSRPEQEFGVTVRQAPPPDTALLAPERLLGSGRYVGERRRSKERDQRREPSRPRPQRRARRTRRLRRVPTIVGVSVASVAAVGAGALALGAFDRDVDRTAPLETVSPIVTVAPTPTAATSTTATPTTASAETSIAPTIAPTVATAAPAIVDAYEGWSGDFDVSGTVVDGNPNFPAGTESDFAMTFEGSCDGATCALRAPEFHDRPWIVQGDRLTAEYDTTEPCPDGSGTATTHVSAAFTVTSRDPAGRPMAATGEVTLETVDAATACADVTNDPVTYAYTMQRAG